MQVLNMPAYAHTLKKIKGELYIYDIVRKKYIFLTPEEWVRQNIVHYLIQEMEYPRALMRVESGLKYGKRLKRSDIIVYNRQGTPFLLIECKAGSIPVSQAVLDQVALYNHTIQASYIAVTNGENYLVYQTNHHTQELISLETFPVFDA